MSINTAKNRFESVIWREVTRLAEHGGRKCLAAQVVFRRTPREAPVEGQCSKVARGPAIHLSGNSNELLAKGLAKRQPNWIKLRGDTVHISDTEKIFLVSLGSESAAAAIGNCLVMTWKSVP